MKVIKSTSKNLDKVLNRNFSTKKRVEEKARQILEDVRLHGDEAVLKYTKKFDRIKLSPKQMKVSEGETNGAYQNIDSEFVSTLKVVMENVTKFYKKQLRKSWKIKDEDGVILGENFTPIQTLGIYIPSGQVPLVSTVYMTVLPAKVAGVGRIILATPPNKYGSVDPHVLVVANLLKVDEIYKIGGAQAIGALAFGTKTIPRVDKIIGPGNEYVTEAKRQVYGYCDIDMMAGPSEVVIIANQLADSKFIIADLAAQAEHHKGLAILITPSKALIKQLRKELIRATVISVKNLDEAAEIANQIAPEHLQVMVKNPNKIIKKIKNAGAIFVGPYTPTAVGDYIAGPSHVLPTGGTARFFSGLSLKDFMKSIHVISYSKKALDKVRCSVEKISGLEGLSKHADSIKIRFKED